MEKRCLELIVLKAPKLGHFRILAVYGAYCVYPNIRRFIRVRRFGKYPLILRNVYGVLYIYVYVVYPSLPKIVLP